jgi:hypothetical protein
MEGCWSLGKVLAGAPLSGLQFLKNLLCFCLKFKIAAVFNAGKISGKTSKIWDK